MVYHSKGFENLESQALSHKFGQKLQDFHS